MASRLFLATLIVCLVFNLATSDDEKEVEEVDKAGFGEGVGETAKGMSNWFKGMAAEGKEKAEDSMDFFKSFSEVGVEKAKDWTKGLGENFGKARETLSETGEKIKDYAVDASEGGMEKAKSWGEGIGETFGKAKERFSETGEKIKEVMGDAMLNTKEDIEAAASKMTNYAKDATGSMMKLFG